MKDSFSIYRSIFYALMAFPPDDAQVALGMIGRYAMDGTLPDSENGAAYGLFCATKPLIDKSAKRAEAGKTGGEATTKQTEANSKQIEANGKQTEANSKQIEAKEEIRNKKVEINNKNILSGKPASVYPYTEIINRLNEKAGTHFLDKSKDTRKHIKARFEEGFTLEDFYTVIDKMTEKWSSNPEMVDYLRPSTLFGTKFESYLNAQPAQEPKAKKVENRFNNFEQRDYDWQDIERRLLARSAAPYEQG